MVIAAAKPKPIKYMGERRRFWFVLARVGAGELMAFLLTLAARVFGAGEGFWSQLKRSMDGAYHVVSPKYLQSYVDEFVFRYNYRGVVVCPLLLERAARLGR